MKLTSKQQLKNIIKSTILKEYATQDIPMLNKSLEDIGKIHEFLLKGGYIEAGDVADKGLKQTSDAIREALQNLYS